MADKKRTGKGNDTDRDKGQNKDKAKPDKGKGERPLSKSKGPSKGKNHDFESPNKGKAALAPRSAKSQFGRRTVSSYGTPRHENGRADRAAPPARVSQRATPTGGA